MLEWIKTFISLLTYDDYIVFGLSAVTIGVAIRDLRANHWDFKKTIKMWEDYGNE